MGALGGIDSKGSHGSNGKCQGFVLKDALSMLLAFVEEQNVNIVTPPPHHKKSLFPRICLCSSRDKREEECVASCSLRFVYRHALLPTDPSDLVGNSFRPVTAAKFVHSCIFFWVTSL
jgi:hypothetical protein